MYAVISHDTGNDVVRLVKAELKWTRSFNSELMRNIIRNICKNAIPILRKLKVDG